MMKRLLRAGAVILLALIYLLGPALWEPIGY